MSQNLLNLAQLVVLALSKRLICDTSPSVPQVFSHACQVSSRSYQVQRRLKGQLWFVLASFTLPTLPRFHFLACSFNKSTFCPKLVALHLCLLICSRCISRYGEQTKQTKQTNESLLKMIIYFRFHCLLHVQCISR